MPHDKDKDYSYTKVEDPTIIFEKTLAPSTIETIDVAMYRWLDETLNLNVLKGKGWEKVPVIWVGAERAYNVKKNKDFRNSRDGSFNLPVITIERTAIVKDLNKRIFGNTLPVDDEQGGSIVVARRINHDKTQNFANADAKRKKGQINFPRKNKKVVYQTISTPAPTFIEVSYSVTLRTEYQQHMNELITPFVTFPVPRGINSFFVHNTGHSYEVFIDGGFNTENNISNLAEEERKFQTKIDLKTMGYLIGDGDNEVKPKTVVRENAVEVKIPRERVIFGDINENLKKDAFYRD
tara:strand:- start:3031 stop:3912 length:882 start_codon:yes stop_codon:yes gene_type:complete